MQELRIGVIAGGNLVEGAHVDVKDQSHIIIASGTTDSHGLVTLTINNSGDYTAFGNKTMPDGEYIGEQSFITDPSGITNVVITITKV
ncbi:MAG: hypothetical protein U0Y96_05660 [Candidatus Kapaibacterium sp.]